MAVCRLVWICVYVCIPSWLWWCSLYGLWSWRALMDTHVLSNGCLVCCHVNLTTGLWGMCVCSILALNVLALRTRPDRDGLGWIYICAVKRVSCMLLCGVSSLPHLPQYVVLCDNQFEEMCVCVSSWLWTCSLHGLDLIVMGLDGHTYVFSNGCLVCCCDVGMFEYVFLVMLLLYFFNSLMSDVLYVPVLCDVWWHIGACADDHAASLSLGEYCYDYVLALYIYTLIDKER